MQCISVETANRQASDGCAAVSPADRRQRAEAAQQKTYIADALRVQSTNKKLTYGSTLDAAHQQKTYKITDHV